MGTTGSILLYPASSPKAITAGVQKKIVSAIVEVMSECGVLQSGAQGRLVYDKLPTVITAEYFGDNPAKGSQLTHVAIAPELLLPALDEVVYTDTAKSFWGEKDKKKRDLIAVPFVDVSVLSKSRTFHDGTDGKPVAVTNVLIEFSYEDARLSPKIHKVKKPRHRLITALEKVLDSKINWCVVS